jgi:DNA repair photolyase
MPMTFDTYNKCSFNCLYCFSYFQKAKKQNKNYITEGEVISVNPEKVIGIFSGKESQFQDYIKNKTTFQWGGLADQFDYYEKKLGITLSLLKFFKKIDYPICFSTKSTWWLSDENYISLFRDQKNWNCKFSIINLDANKAKLMEKGVPSPQERLLAIKKFSELNAGGATLRLRPFIIGLTDKDDEHLKLIELAAENGATAVSTEFLCLDSRADEAQKQRYMEISKIIGFDIFKFYQKYSTGAGYFRLNKELKIKYFIKMKELCDKLGLRFYVSDAHGKELCSNGSCCGLPETWNYSRGQFTEALVIAKQKGQVSFKDMEPHVAYLKKILWRKAEGFNTTSTKTICNRYNQTLYDFFREAWNDVNAARSPYKYFHGALIPIGLDQDKNVIYKFQS